MADAPEGFREKFWTVVCQSPVVGVDLLVGHLTLLVLLAAAVPFVEPGTSSYVVLVITAAMNAAGVAIVGTVLWKCGFFE